MIDLITHAAVCCDECETEITIDIVLDRRAVEDNLIARGWLLTGDGDYCPACGVSD